MNKFIVDQSEKISDQTFIFADKSTFTSQVMNLAIETVAKFIVELEDKSKLKQRYRYLHDEWKPSKED